MSQVKENVIKLYEALEKRRLNSSDSDYRWLNLGYWKNAKTIFEACNDMLDLIIKQANINDGNLILDVGFGYGIQDIIIAERFPNATITAINIIDEQIKYAQRQIKNTSLENRINYIKKDAVEISFPENTFDSIIAIESAFHFDTREEFLKKAYKTLKPEGRICLADGIQHMQYINQHKNLQERLGFLGIPEENLIDENGYLEMLVRLGYKNIEIINISEWVIPYAATYISMENREWRNNEGVNPFLYKEKLDEFIENFINSTLFNFYVLVYATK